MIENEYTFEITEFFLDIQGWKKNVWFDISESNNDPTLKFIDYIYEFKEGYFQIEITFCYVLTEQPKHWTRTEYPTIEIIINDEAISISKANGFQLLSFITLFKKTI